MNEVPHPGFDKPEEYETFLTTNGLEDAAKQFVGYDMDTDYLRDYEVGISAFKLGRNGRRIGMKKPSRPQKITPFLLERTGRRISSRRTALPTATSSRKKNMTWRRTSLRKS